MHGEPMIKKYNQSFVIVLLFLFLLAVAGIFYYQSAIRTAHYNLQAAMAGRLLEQLPDARAEIAVAVLHADSATSLTAGKALLKESGIENIPSSSMQDGALTRKFVWMCGVALLCAGVLFYAISFGFLRHSYRKLVQISGWTQELAAGQYTKTAPAYEEGEYDKIFQSLAYISERIQEGFLRLKNEKEFLKSTISDISHQLKTPLTSSKLFLDILRENENIKPEKTQEFYAKIAVQLDRMEWLIVSMLKMARLDAGAIQFNMKPNDIVNTVREAILSLSNIAQPTTQIVVSGPEHAIIPHDSSWMSEAFTNIIKNCLEHTRDRVEVQIEANAILTYVTISDNGEGIAPEELHRIFHRFYKGQNSVNPAGVGIGLALAKSIIENHRGSITAGNKKDGGAVFTIALHQ